MLKVIGGVSYVVSTACQWSIKLDNIDEVKLNKEYLLGCELIEIQHKGQVKFVGGEKLKQYFDYYKNEYGYEHEGTHLFFDAELYEWLYTNFCTKSILF